MFIQDYRTFVKICQFSLNEKVYEFDVEISTLESIREIEKCLQNINGEFDISIINNGKVLATVCSLQSVGVVDHEYNIDEIGSNNVIVKCWLFIKAFAGYLHAKNKISEDTALSV